MKTLWIVEYELSLNDWAWPFAANDWGTGEGWAFPTRSAALSAAKNHKDSLHLNTRIRRFNQAVETSGNSQT